MGMNDRKKKFEAAAKQNPLCGADIKIARGFGASNGLMVVDVGLELLDADLDGVNSSHDGFLLLSGTSLPPNDELYLAVYIKSDAKTFHERLKEMIQIGKAEKAAGDTPTHNIKNNNTAIIVTWEDGKMYLRNKGHWNGDAQEIDFDSFGTGITADRVAVAVYPPNRDAARSLNVRTYISYVAKLFKQDKIHEIHPWDTSEKDFEHFKVNLNDVNIPDLKTKIEKLGCYYTGDIIERFHLALNHLPTKHFVILAGLSGTGKTTLAIRYSQAVHGIENAEEKDPFLFMCRVRPDWTDPTGLIGYPDIVSGKYVVPEFLEAILTAHAYPNIPVIVCLDEMNLARVEYYFSDVLSCVESAPESHVTLHHDSIPMEGSNGEDIPSSIPVPANLYVVGTINVDETTNPLSNKVLDRANVIDMSSVDLDGFLDNLATREPALAAATKAVKSVLPAANKILSGHSMGFGYRVAEEVVRYYDFSMKNGTKTQDEVLDHLLSQKILTKLKGTERQRTMLTSLIDMWKAFPVTSETLGRLVDEIDEMGGFQTLR